MKIKSIKEIKTKEQAKQIAIEWQYWQAKKALSYKEIFIWAGFFELLGAKFGLKREFKRNGLI